MLYTSKYQCMSSRKNLKKQINEVMNILYADCILYKVYTQNPDVEKADQIISQIAIVHDELLKRVSITEGKEAKGRVKAYYNKLMQDFKTNVDQIGQEIQKLD